MVPVHESDLIVRKLRAFCRSHSIPTEGALVVTVHRNRTTEFASVIVRWDNEQLLPLYPLATDLQQYSELKVGDFFVVYKAKLDLTTLDAALGRQPADDSNSLAPFCCNNVRPYKARQLDREQLFKDFLTSSGHHPNVVFEVKRQVDNGPLLSTTYFKLVHNCITKAPEHSYNQKLHAFKNYKCTEHNLFFGVDLYCDGDTTGAKKNVHHMRLNQFAHHNMDVLGDFFSQESAK
eukprot:CAMPEP_0118921566 /NCGR_PEP_ID=MMETSP1169-20130426/794_1 /TAXON_ID=36882 /ORGANISM="Pyramimonas obovata, Strain CCMP722" /LENGTH=233 /DNA_ID=CAMNT_0006862311 /DNA_START=122 /DNA_END=823 /DNA_ORIENTATION=+